MKRMNRLIYFPLMIAAVYVTASFGYRESERTFDFEFKEMELFRATESIAKLMGQYVIFTGGLKNSLVNISLTDVTPEFAMRLLLESNGAFSTEKQGVLYISPLSERKPAMTVPTIIPLINVIAKDIEPNLKGYLSKESTYTINDQKNAFIINAKEDEVTRIRQLIQELDQEVSQIFIEARIIETSTSFSRRLGMEWGAPNMRGSGTTLDTPVGVNVSGMRDQGLDQFLGRLRIGLSKGSRLDAMITAGERNGDLKIISSPKITTLNGTAATIDTQANLTLEGTTTTATTGPTVTQTTLLQTLTSALKFRVTPYIVSDDQVRLNIELTKSDPIGDQAKAISNVSTNHVTTSLMVRNGQTASLGGIMTQLKKKDDAGMPFLAHIPVLGFLFGSQGRETNDRELLVFMTPTIYKGSKGISARRRESSVGAPATVSEALENLRESPPDNNVEGIAFTAPSRLESVAPANSELTEAAPLSKLPQAESDGVERAVAAPHGAEAPLNPPPSQASSAPPLLPEAH